MNNNTDPYIEEHKMWDSHHSMASPIYNVRKYLIFKLLPQTNSRDQICLDAGCGTGIYTIELLKRGFEVHAFDLSEYALDKLQKQLPEHYKSKFTGFVSDIFHFNTAKRYDFIILSEVLEHIEDDAAALIKIVRLLKPNGEILITIPYDPKLWSKGDEISKHVRRYTKKDVFTLIKSSNLILKKLWIYGFPILRIWLILKKNFITINIMKKADNKENIKRNRALFAISAILEYLEHLILFFDRKLLTTSHGVGIIALCDNVFRETFE